VLFRFLRGSGIGGLAGMAARTKRDGVSLARPLLSLSKAELIAYCEAEDVDFFRDPSNENPHFARTRMRALLKTLAAEGLDASALARLARRAAKIEEALERQTLAAESHLHLIENGVCDAAKLFAEPIEIVQRLLTQTIARVGKREPSRIGLEKIERLTADLHEAWLARERFGANVAGAHVICDAKGVLRVAKEPARGTAPKASRIVAIREDGAD
jgi:tRNA(Ile)-lysidine synthase